MVSFTLYSRERTNIIHCRGDSLGPRDGMDVVEKRKIPIPVAN
jgi:hypothetical protein